MRASKRFARKLKQRLDEKQNAMERIPAVMGDGAGNLLVSGQNDYVYCTIGGQPAAVYNNRVVNQIGLAVWVGRTPEEPNLFQVLSTRSATPGGVDNAQGGFAPAKRYEWHAVGGGQDPLAVHLRAFSFLRLGVSNTTNTASSLYVDLYRGWVHGTTGFISIARQDINLFAQIPSTIDKAALVLITIDNTGAVVQTKGSEVATSALTIADLPAVPSGTVFLCGAVRVYYGQTVVQDGRTNTDIWDGRFSWMAGANTPSVAWGSITGALSAQTDLQAALDATRQLFIVTEDLTSQITGATAHFTLTAAALSAPHVYGNLRQQPADVTMDADFKGFTLSYTPTTSDKLIVDYYPASTASFMYDDAGSILVDDAGSFILEA